MIFSIVYARMKAVEGDQDQHHNSFLCFCIKHRELFAVIGRVSGLKKKTFYTELAYVLGIVSLVFGVTFMERADFGLSMVVAPAYVLHRYLSTLPGMGWFSFGVAEYTLQLVLVLVLMVIVRKFRVAYFFSFVTAVIYGWMLDLVMWLTPTVDAENTAMRIVLFVIGELFCTLGVSLVFHTYIPPEAYELFVAEVAKKFNQPTGRVKWIYDIISCLTAIALSFLFFGFGKFVGVNWGTALCAVINGVIISAMIKWENQIFEFKDGLNWRRFFEK